MKSRSLEMLLNPIHMGIVQILIGGRRLSTQQIGEQLPHVPQATLYRYLNKLLKAGFIDVAEENKVRGTVEKVYCLNMKSLDALSKDAGDLSIDDHKKFFFTYMMGLMDELERYFEKDGIDAMKDGLSYRQGKYYMNTAEYSEFVNDLKNAFEKVIGNMPTPDRVARTIGLVMIPDGIYPKKPEPEDKQEDREPP